MNRANPTSQVSSGIVPPEAEQRLKDDAGAVAETARQDLESVKHEAEAQLGKTVEKAKGLASEQKNLFANQMTDIAEAVSKVASELEAKDSATAVYARTVADSADRIGRTIRERDIDGLIATAEDFGRKQPALFIAAAALAGLAASRFFVASAKRRHAGDGSYPNSPDYTGSSGSVAGSERYDELGEL